MTVGVGTKALHEGRHQRMLRNMPHHVTLHVAGMHGSYVNGEQSFVFPPCCFQLLEHSRHPLCAEQDKHSHC